MLTCSRKEMTMSTFTQDMLPTEAALKAAGLVSNAARHGSVTLLRGPHYSGKSWAVAYAQEKVGDVVVATIDPQRTDGRARAFYCALARAAELPVALQDSSDQVRDNLVEKLRGKTLVVDPVEHLRNAQLDVLRTLVDCLGHLVLVGSDLGVEARLRGHAAMNARVRIDIAELGKGEHRRPFAYTTEAELAKFFGRPSQKWPEAEGWDSAQIAQLYAKTSGHWGLVVAELTRMRAAAVRAGEQQGHGEQVEMAGRQALAALA
jgi:AAA domain